MVRRLGLCAALFATMFVSGVTVSPSVQAEVSTEFSILLSDKSNVATPIEIVVADGVDSATQLLYLIWEPALSEEISIDDVTIQAFANDATVTITSSTTPLELRKGTPVPFNLKVTDIPTLIPDEDPLLGSIVVSVLVEDAPGTTSPDPASPAARTETFEVANFNVSRAPAKAKPGDVVFVGADAEGIKSETLLSSADISIRVQNTSGSAAAVTVTLGSLRGPRGEALLSSGEREPSTDPLAAGATRDFTFVVEGLDSIGDYRGFVDIAVDGKAGASTAVTVSRKSSALTLTVSPGVADHIALGDDARATVMVENTGSFPVHLMFELGQAKVADEEADDVASPILESACSSKPDANATANTSDPCWLEAGAKRPFVIELKRVDDLGRVTAPIIITAVGYSGSTSVDVEVVTRRSISSAVVIYSLGVLFSFLVFGVTRKRRKAAAQHLALARTFARLNSYGWPEPATATEIKVRRTLEARGIALSEDTNSTSFDDDAASFTRQVELTESWLKLSIAGRALVDPPMPEIDTLADSIIKTDLTVADLQTATASVTALRNVVPVEAVVRRIRPSFDMWVIDVGPAADVAEDISKAFEEARKKAEATDQNGALQIVASAEKRWRTELDRTLSTLREPPAYAGRTFLTDASGIVAQVAAGSGQIPEPEAYYGAFKAALRRLMKLHRDEFARHARALRPKDPADQSTLVAIADEATAMSLEQSLSSFCAAIHGHFERLKEIEPQPDPDARENAGAPPPPPPGKAPDPDIGVRALHPTPISPDRKKVPTVSKAKRWLLAWEVAGTIGAGLLAIVVALSTVYDGDPSWGSERDIVAALIWAAGISTAGQFGGVWAFRKQLLSEDPPQ